MWLVPMRAGIGNFPIPKVLIGFLMQNCAEINGLWNGLKPLEYRDGVPLELADHNEITPSEACDFLPEALRLRGYKWNAFNDFRRGQQAGALQIALDNIKRFTETYPQSHRLRRFKGIAEVLVQISQGRTREGFRMTRELYADVLKPAFDLEAAMNVLCLLSRLLSIGFPQDDFEAIGRKIAQRFAVTRSANQVMLSAAMNRADVEAWLSQALNDTSRAAENAVDLTLKEDYKGAVESLLIYGEQTCNARVIDLAGSLLKRHREKIEGVKSLIDTQGVLSRRYCVPSTHIAGIRRSGRSSGGMVLKA